MPVLRNFLSGKICVKVYFWPPKTCAELITFLQAHLLEVRSVTVGKSTFSYLKCTFFHYLYCNKMIMDSKYWIDSFSAASPAL